MRSTRSVLVLTISALGMVGPGSSHAQVRIADNEPVEGRLSGKHGEFHVYQVEVREDEQTIKFRVICKTTQVVAELFDGKRKVPLLLPNGRGWHANRGLGKDFYCHTEPLARGKYLLQITPHREGGAGPYTVEVVEPTMGGSGRSGYELQQLRKSVQTIRLELDRAQALLDRLESKRTDDR